MKKTHLTLAALIMFSAVFAQHTPLPPVTFNYTGAVQTYTVPACVYSVQLDVKGAEGNGNSNGGFLPGKGGEITGTLSVTPGEVLNIYVGGGAVNTYPADTNGGWNGGGGGGASYFDPNWGNPICYSAWGGGGGGASDIRVGGLALANRVIVAGGGGGTGGDRISCCGPGAGGGGGGGYYGGGGGGGYSGLPGTGGTQAAGGAGGLSPGCSIFGGMPGDNGALGVGGIGGEAPANCQAGPNPGCQAGAGGAAIGQTGVNCTSGGCPGTWSGGSGGGGSNWAEPCVAAVVSSQGTNAAVGEIVITPICGGAPLAVTLVPTNPTCGGGCNGSITANVTGGTAPYTYNWTPGGATTQTITGLCAGSYTVSVEDATGCVTVTASVTLTSNSINVTANNTGDDPCNGDCIGSASSTVVGGNAPYTYAWTPSGGANPTASNLCAGTYTLTVKDINGCTGTSAVTISQPPALTLGASGTPILCNGQPTTLTATANGGTPNYTYLWVPGGNTNAVASGMSAGSYTVTVTDAHNCTTNASVTITQPAGMNVSLTGPQLICIGGNGTLTATVTGGATPYTYAWPGLGSVTNTANITPVATQTYTVDVTDNNGCSVTADITVQFGGPPIFVTVTGNTSVCSGLQTSLCANATGGTGGNTFLWQPGNLSTPCITIAPTATTIYTVTVEDNCGRTATVTTTINVNSLPAVNFNANIYQGCTPLCTQFYNTTTMAQGSVSRYTWTFGTGDTAQESSPIYCYKNSGKYDVTLTVTSDSGCSSTLKKTNLMTAYASPAAAFGVSPQPATIIAPTIQFTDKSSDQYGVKYWWWNFGDESGTTNSSNLQNPSHTYQDTGRFCANLVVMDEHGCTDTATSCLVIDPSFNLYIPSAFSPNGDGKNDVFLPKGQYIKSFEMYIFDRWGAQIYHSTDITKGWNGTVGGSTMAQEDTYVYKILVTDSQNKSHSYTGNISIIK